VTGLGRDLGCFGRIALGPQRAVTESSHSGRVVKGWTEDRLRPGLGGRRLDPAVPPSHQPPSLAEQSVMSHGPPNIDGVSSRQLLAMVALGWALLSCGGGGGRSTGPAPKLGAAQVAAWKACGATGSPPVGVAAEPASLPPTANQAAAAVSDADGRRWVAGFLREQAIEAWAQTALQDGLLSGPCLGDAAVNPALFGDEVQKVQLAQQSKARVEVRLPKILDLRVVAVPAQAQEQIANQQYARSAYALVVHGQGPAYNRLVYPDGRQDVWAEVKADQAFYGFYGGEYQAGARRGVGPLWYQKSVLNCLTGFLREVCGT
jgi:hypothetical protein